MALNPGDDAPDFELSLLPASDAGDSDPGPEALKLKEMLVGGPALLVFVKEGCPTCQYSLPFLERMYQSYPRSRVSMAVIAQEEAPVARKMVHHFGIPTLPLLLDPDPFPVSERYELSFVPTFFYVGQDGKIEATFESFDREKLRSFNEVVARANEVPLCPLFTEEEGVPPFRPG
ncbi:MAG: TlpA disulfide reductase family protein [Acidobacteriota bacterium]